MPRKLDEIPPIRNPKRVLVGCNSASLFCVMRADPMQPPIPQLEMIRRRIEDQQLHPLSTILGHITQHSPKSIGSEGVPAIGPSKGPIDMPPVEQNQPSNVRMMFYHLGSKALLLSLEAALAKISS
jgi:hypothetical protein